MSTDLKQALTHQLVNHEGLRTTGYADSKGYLTIGVGRLIDHRGGGITEQEALYLLDHDIARVFAELDEHLPWWRQMNEVRQRVICDMCFQLGIHGLMRFHNAVGAMQQQNYVTAATEMLNSKWATVDSPTRAWKLAYMMRTGQDYGVKKEGLSE